MKHMFVKEKRKWNHYYHIIPWVVPLPSKFLVSDPPQKKVLSTVTGRGDNPNYTYCWWFRNLAPVDMVNIHKYPQIFTWVLYILYGGAYSFHQHLLVHRKSPIFLPEAPCLENSWGGRDGHLFQNNRVPGTWNNYLRYINGCFNWMIPYFFTWEMVV